MSVAPRPGGQGHFSATDRTPAESGVSVDITHLCLPPLRQHSGRFDSDVLSAADAISEKLNIASNTIAQTRLTAQLYSVGQGACPAPERLLRLRMIRMKMPLIRRDPILRDLPLRRRQIHIPRTY